MIRLHVLCEGQSEESFTKTLLYDHFSPRGIFCTPFLFSSRERYKGGIVTYGKVRRQIQMLCNQDKSAYVTTFIDYYRLPKDYPEFERRGRDAVDDVCRAEEAFQQDIDHLAPNRNFIANIISHEFEALLFSDTRAFSSLPEQERLAVLLEAIRAAFPTPEHIDDGPDTAPSKRILGIYPQYEKVLHGTSVALDIGLDVIRRECPKFDRWLTRLESLATR